MRSARGESRCEEQGSYSPCMISRSMRSIRKPICNNKNNATAATPGRAKTIISLSNHPGQYNATAAAAKPAVAAATAAVAAVVTAAAAVLVPGGGKL